MTSDEKKNNLHLLENTKQYFGLCVTVTPIIDQKKRFHPTTDSPSCPAVPKGTSFTRRYLSRELVLPTKPAFPSIRVHSRRVCIVTKKKKEEEGGKRGRTSSESKKGLTGNRLNVWCRFGKYFIYCYSV
jgi:hypothetical protein